MNYNTKKRIWCAIVMILSALALYITLQFDIKGDIGLAIFAIVTIVEIAAFVLFLTPLKKKRKPIPSYDYKYCILALLAKVMKSDGENLNCELDKVKETIQRHYKTSIDQRKALNQFMDLLNDKNLTYGEYCDSINKNKYVNDVIKSEIIMELLAVVYADEEARSSEMFMVNRIRKALNINQTEYDRILRIFLKKYNSGFYKASKKEDKYDQTTDIYNLKYCILLLIAKVMKADGKQMVCELDKVKEIICKYYKTEEEQKKALSQFKEILNDNFDTNVVNRGYDIKKVCDIINKTNKRVRLVNYTNFITDLLEIIYADDQYTKEETEVLVEIRKFLNISSYTYEKIRTQFLKKHQNKKSQKAKDEQKKERQKSYNESKSKWNSNESEKKSNNSSNSNSNKVNRITYQEAMDILGVAGDASDAEIKKAYHALAVKYHPDYASSMGDEAIRQATESMKQINVAWDVVKMARGIK